MLQQENIINLNRVKQRYEEDSKTLIELLSLKNIRYAHWINMFENFGKGIDKQKSGEVSLI